MSDHHKNPHWKVLLLATSILFLAACSANRLAYNNLDWLIRWKVDDYVSLDREQQRWLAARTDAHLAWHCSRELPRYLPLLDELDSTTNSNSPDAAMLLAGLPRVEAAVDRLLLEIAPTAAGLLRQLDDRQVGELQTSLQEKHAELEEKYTGPDLATQHQERMERAEERLEDWLGPLSSQQITRLAAWSAGLQGHNAIWLQNRQAWQQIFLQALQDRQAPEFEQRITALLIERESYWTDDFKRVAWINREQAALLTADLLQMASSRQKQHLAERLDKLRADIEALSCTVS